MNIQERPGGTVASGTRADGGELSTDAIFETLSSQRRRYTLHYLKQRDEAVTVRDLSIQVAAWENGIDRSAVTPKERKRVYTALHQTHLPKMQKLEVIEYDRDRGTVELRAHMGAFDIYLDVVPADDLPWGQFYLALGAVFAALVTVGSLGVYPFSLVPGFVYAFVVTVVFVVAAAYHTVRERQSQLGVSDTPMEVRTPPEVREAHDGEPSPGADD